MAELTTAAHLIGIDIFVQPKYDIDITENTYSLPGNAVSSAFLWIRHVYTASCATTGIAIR